MSNVKEINHAEQQAVAQMESIVEMVANLQLAQESNDLEHVDVEEAQQAIQEDPLSVQVRSDWRDVGAEAEDVEFIILLCTGGPAVRIIGDIGLHGQPEHPRLQYQDWGTPWTEYFPSSEQRDALQTYCDVAVNQARAALALVDSKN